jgi:cytochrome c biogenesis protein CcmG/thiol:disulfide interchange protein DsbE
LIPNSYSLTVKPVLTATALLAVLLIGGCGSSDNGNPDSRLTPEQATAPISGAPPGLAAIRGEANQLLDGGREAFEARLEELRGTPVVVNKWASWCGPCRFEFPWFQSLAEKRGGEIAFLGVNSNDSSGAAEQFLSELPLPYPSYSDPDLDIAENLGGPPLAMPATAFYDRSGKLAYTHIGQYPDEAALIAEVDKYSSGG